MVLLLEIKLFGMYQFTYEDLFVRPDIYPWLANVYIDEEYRNKLMERAKNPQELEKMWNEANEIDPESMKIISKNDKIIFNIVFKILILYPSS